MTVTKHRPGEKRGINYHRTQYNPFGIGTVFRPDATRLTELGFGAVAHVPVLFDARGKLHRESSRYLRERATLRWHPAMTTSGRRTRPKYPKPLTLWNIGCALINFGGWGEAHSDSFDWKTCEYSDVRRYQADQRSGAWSEDGRPLQPETANGRTDEVTHYLQWTGAVHLRPTPFEVKVSLRRKKLPPGPSGRERHVSHYVRLGREPESRSKALQNSLGLPTPQEIRAWLCALRERRGPAKEKAGRSVLELGWRSHELEAATVDQWPSQDTLLSLRARGQPYAAMELVVTKGGIPRDIMIPIEFAFEIRNWIDGQRLRLAWAFHKREGRMASRQIFLSDAYGYEGIPISANTLYRCFSEVEPHPARWCPRFGRHAYACYYTLHALEAEARIAGRALSEMGADWITSRGRWWLNTLRRQLGHLDEQTTEIYLRWLITSCGLAEMASGWHHFLNSEET